jgi:lipopolysaccharide export system protein LptA
LKLFIALLFLTSLLFSAKLQIEGDSFVRNQKKKLSSFTGNVKIKKDRDELNATKVLVYVDDENHPIKYEALGDVSFKVTTEDNVTYQGRSQRLIFLPEIKEYQFYKEVFIEEKATARTLSGEKIILSMASGNAKIAGKAKVPVRVTFELDDKNSTKKGLNNKSKDSNKTAVKAQ